MPRTSRSRSPSAIGKRPQSVLGCTFVQRKPEPENSARVSLIFHVRRPSLQFHQPIRRFREDRELRQLPAHHRHLIAAMKPWTSMAIFVDLVRKILPLSNRKSLACEEIGLAR